MYMESSVPDSWNPGRQSSIHGAPRQIPNWNPALYMESWNPVRQSSQTEGFLLVVAMEALYYWSNVS
jgi:hypothetical protein